MSCPLTVTHVLYRAKAYPHPGPLPRRTAGEGAAFLSDAGVRRFLFASLPPSGHRWLWAIYGSINQSRRSM